MRTIAILILLSIFVFQSVSVEAQEALGTIDAHEIVGVVGTWGSIGVVFAGFIPLGIGGLQHPSRDSLTISFAASMGLTGLTGGLLGLVGYNNWGLLATITGGIVLGMGLMVVPAIISMQDDLTNANSDNIANVYSAPELWIALVPPTVWLLGLGIVSLVLEDSNSSVARTLNNENVSITPVVAPGKVGFMASLRFP